MKSSTNQLWPIICVCFAIVIGMAVPAFWRSSTDDSSSLTVYCAHDATFAESVIAAFEKQTGINVDVRFDEEANKSLGLTNLLVAEKDNPRCDVFWNNQTLGTIRLANHNVLQPYISSNADRIPKKFRDAEGLWTGFAARLRVYIVNTDKLAATPEAIAALLESESLERVTIAQPLFGTTLSHYSVLADQWGIEQLKTWHTSIHDRGVREVRGNSMTRDLVVEEVCDLGFTDTDDAYSALDNGKQLAILPVRLADGSTICMPNSVAMIRNCPDPEAAKQFIDFVLSEQTELMLAQSAARQIPLGRIDEALLSEEVKQLREWAADGVELNGAATINQQVLDWLTAEYTGR
ncbi:MAG: extracellular solute-binding protein [Fuerstiella sp.]|jgi:iron(III) transport system substrate-binding protein